MTEEARKPLAVVALALAVLAYYFIAPRRLEPEFVLKPAWTVRLETDAEADAAPGASETTLGFELEGFHGQASPDGRLLSVSSKDFRAAVRDGFSIPYASDTEGLVAFDAYGAPAFDIAAPGLPWFSSGRLFLAGPEMGSVSEYSESGVLLWTLDLPAPISAFAADEALAVAGLVDGTIVAIERDGSIALRTAPGGSRIEIILGLAVDSGRGRIAAICGIDRQRFVLLSRTGGAYRVSSHSYLDSDFRRPVSIRLAEDGQHAWYEGSDGMIVRSLDDGSERKLDFPSRDFTISEDPARGLTYLLARGEKEATLVVVAAPDRVLARYALPGAEAFARAYGDLVFTGSGDSLAAFAAGED
ncbi:MAG: hypothetical protein JXA15_12880 [Spirochaetales bacterium]|nr:hypothetical protein [Spirochaetales bacterium]